MIDLQYTFVLQSFGLVRSNTLKEFVYRRPSWYAMRNVYALFDDDTLPQGITEVQAGSRTLSNALFTRFGLPLRVLWFSDRIPDSGLDWTPVDLEVPERMEDPGWVELITGRVCGIPRASAAGQSGGLSLRQVPLWDSPVIVAPRAAILLQAK